MVEVQIARISPACTVRRWLGQPGELRSASARLEPAGYLVAPMSASPTTADDFEGGAGAPRAVIGGAFALLTVPSRAWIRSGQRAAARLGPAADDRASTALSTRAGGRGRAVVRPLAARSDDRGARRRSPGGAAPAVCGATAADGPRDRHGRPGRAQRRDGGRRHGHRCPAGKARTSASAGTRDDARQGEARRDGDRPGRSSPRSEPTSRRTAAICDRSSTSAVFIPS